MVPLLTLSGGCNGGVTSTALRGSTGGPCRRGSSLAAALASSVTFVVSWGSALVSLSALPTGGGMCLRLSS